MPSKRQIFRRRKFGTHRQSIPLDHAQLLRKKNPSSKYHKHYCLLDHAQLLRKKNLGTKRHKCQSSSPPR